MSPQQNLPAPNYQPEAYYPHTTTFPPPPNAQYSPQPAYNPAEYNTQPPPPTQQVHPDYGYQPPQGYTPTQNMYSPEPANPYGPPPTSARQAPPNGQGRRADENVSAGPYYPADDGS
jgi:hypothetical protein